MDREKWGIKFLNISRAEGDDMSSMMKISCLSTK